MELKYTKMGDYFVPNIEISSDNKNANLGKYGRMREQYLKENRPGKFEYLRMKEELTKHLIKVENEANEYEEMLIKQMTEKENVNEKLKEANQMEWVQRMNNIKNRAQEIVMNEMIYD